MSHLIKLTAKAGFGLFLNAKFRKLSQRLAIGRYYVDSGPLKILAMS